jgi:molybdate transport system ATP-binding protein
VNQGLTACLQVQVGDLCLDVELEAQPGEIVALLGPNGAGKTTLLRALAGLRPIAKGLVTLDGTVLEDTSRRITIPAEDRPIGVVFQDYLLFPHLSVVENVAFGLRCRGTPRREARRQAHGWLEQVGLAAFDGSQPSELSGGQRQRVALARALATSPRLLLLDEPLAALDASTRLETRRALLRQLARYDGVRLIVTHEPLEAMAMADRLIVIEGGRITHEGTPSDISERPRSRYVADLVGVNLFAGSARGNEIQLEDGMLLLVPEPVEGRVFAVVHPRAVALHKKPPEGGSPSNVWCGVADSFDFEGERVRVRVEGPLDIVAELARTSIAELGLCKGDDVWVAVKATEVSVYPA